MKTLCLLVFLVTSAFAQETWLYSVNVTIKEHDAQDLLLSDGRQAEPLDFRQVADALPVGSAVQVAYNDARGVVLIDAKTSKHYPLNMIRGDHPIDIVEESCLKVADTMQAMIDCSAKASDSWEAEMHRAYDRVLEGASEEGRQKLAASQARWKEFFDSQCEVILELYSLELAGTLGRLSQVDAVGSLFKERALSLAELVLPN